MIELTTENTQKAIERCKQLKPKVTFVSNRVFNVSSSRNSNIYQVRFDVQKGKKLAQCNCKASEKNLVCYHWRNGQYLQTGLETSSRVKGEGLI